MLSTCQQTTQHIQILEKSTQQGQVEGEGNQRDDMI